jgi:hypothetical protein
MEKNAHTFDNLCKALRDELIQIKNPNFNDVTDIIDKEIKTLTKEGIVVLGNDYSLTDKALEYRVHSIFEAMEFKVSDGRPKLEDLLIRASNDLQPNIPLIVEIKSSGKYQSPSREDLRQLDDYVFELSGEERWRKIGLLAQAGKINKNPMFQGAVPPSVGHPTPHKGIFIFNGPSCVPFEKRSQNWLGANEMGFVKQRGFCILTFYCLISWLEAFKHDESIAGIFWKKIHETCGILAPYSYK